MLVHPHLEIAALTRKEPRDPVASPVPAGQLPAEIEVPAPHLVGLMPWGRDGARNLVAQGVGEALIGVEREDPWVAGPREGGVPLVGDRGSGLLQHHRAGGTGLGDRVVARAAVGHDDLVRPVELAEAVLDLQALVVGGDDDRERHGHGASEASLAGPAGRRRLLCRET